MSRASKTFIVQKDVAGKSVRVTIGKYPTWTPDQARERARELIVDMDRGINPNEQKRELRSRGVTLEDAVGMHLEAMAAKECALGSREAVQDEIGRYLQPWLRRPLKDITRDECARRHSALTDQNGRYAANRALAHFRACFNTARRRHPDSIPGDPRSRISYSLRIANMTSARSSCLTAAIADKYSLYTLAFQEPQADVRFCDRLFRQRVGRPPVFMREDFCGTAAISCDWVRSCDERLAICVDLHAEPLAWCRDHLVPTLPEECRHRIELVRDDALTVSTPFTDIIVALNSSFFVFKQLDQLLTYFRRCLESLNDDGLIVLGLYAGPEAQMVGIDELSLDGFDAVWEQSAFNSVTNEATTRIHFKFWDGSSITNAFVYDWRMWSPRELTDAFRAAGFREAAVYSKGNVRGGHERIEECRIAHVTTCWDAFVVGFK